jgi:hypothetical protein
LCPPNVEHSQHAIEKTKTLGIFSPPREEYEEQRNVQSKHYLRKFSLVQNLNNKNEMIPTIGFQFNF